MKKMFVLLLLVSAVVTTFAQDPTLTKAETISYLNNKIKAVIGQKEPSCSSCSDKLLNAYIKEADGLIEIYYSQEMGSGRSWSCTYRFNPKYIDGITLMGSNATVRSINIFIPNNSGMKTTSDYSSFWKDKNMSFLFLDNDPDNFKKIKKAFLYLKDLYKAEADPFGD